MRPGLLPSALLLTASAACVGTLRFVDAGIHGARRLPTIASLRGGSDRRPPSVPSSSSSEHGRDRPTGTAAASVVQRETIVDLEWTSRRQSLHVRSDSDSDLPSSGSGSDTNPSEDDDDDDDDDESVVTPQEEQLLRQFQAPAGTYRNIEDQEREQDEEQDDYDSNTAFLDDSDHSDDEQHVYVDAVEIPRQPYSLPTTTNTAAAKQTVSRPSSQHSPFPAGDTPTDPSPALPATQTSDSNPQPRTKDDTPATRPDPLQEGLQQAVFEARAGSATDDEGSSAFLDRMELADAYDEGETTAGESYTASIAAQEEDDEEDGRRIDDNSDTDNSRANAHKRTVKHNRNSVEDDGDSRDNTNQDKPPSSVGKSVDAPSTAASGTVASTAKTAATIKEVTPTMKEELSKLKYTSKDVKQIKPHVAAFIIKQQLLRPTEGLPPACFVSTQSKQHPQRNRNLHQRRSIRRAAIVAAVATVAVIGMKTQDVDLEDLWDAVQETSEQISVTAKGWLASVFQKHESVEPTIQPPVAATESVIASEPEQQPVEQRQPPQPQPQPQYDNTPHSVKPGTTKAEMERELDVTWLDKAITRVGNAIRGFFRMEI